MADPRPAKPGSAAPGSATPGSATPGNREAGIRLALAQAVAAVLPAVSADAVTDDKSLRDLGADSIDYVEIVTTLLESVRADVPLSSIADAADIGALVSLLCAAPDAART